MLKARSITLLCFCLGLIGCDQGTKQLAQKELRGAAPVELVGGFLDLRYGENRGVAFNLERLVSPLGRMELLLALGLVAVVVLAVAWRRTASAPLRVRLGLALVTAGALGNLLDRALRGYVIDFVHVVHWPVFNVADALLAVGVPLLVLGGNSVADTQKLDRA